MKQKQLEVTKDSVYEMLLTRPAWSDQKIANESGFSRSYVWNLRQKFLRTLDWALAQNVAGAFLSEFQMCSDAFKLQITQLEDKKIELEEWKEGTKTIFRKGEDGHTFPE